MTVTATNNPSVPPQAQHAATAAAATQQQQQQQQLQKELATTALRLSHNHYKRLMCVRDESQIVDQFSTHSKC